MPRRCACFIVPPHIFKEISQRGTPEQRSRALDALALTEQLRGRREVLAALPAVTPAEEEHRTIYDARGKLRLPGKLARGEGDPVSKDPAVNEAYDGAGATYHFYSEIFGRNSIDDRGMRLDSTVHYGEEYDNAFWNGHQMVYGDGDGDLFQRFTLSLDVIAHELTHGVTASEADFDYYRESGALNESFSDVFGSLVKQRSLKQTAEQADWIVGAELFTPKVNGRGIRSLKAPGTAYDDPVLGRDPQPSHMNDFYEGDEDSGGVHINSGIPNHAFYLAAVGIGGYAWERAGNIWYIALRDRLRHTADFSQSAAVTVAVAGELFGVGNKEHKAVENAWKSVGVAVDARAAAEAGPAAIGAPRRGAETRA